ncbi:uncharacterized protein LOC111711213 isoform X2 [Eurytemora carolleeae]|uniref:uncharacterized protein LOC111711213 isoform X2 n=1 Tax=Eurytemora carolleeae TaxID=1294199 RepID=UPI000C75E961|nr:uncharacterized protein LOC111711213 isoform X2 [Eurytemora carolleeae]|eukprot:XP_023341269.1 uncharacterized protein LOC111711213 isoform X2 [Eurytemora affinis]
MTFYSLPRPTKWMRYALVSVVLVFYLIKTPGDLLSEDASAPGARSLPAKPRVWVSMGICWGQNAQVHGKKEFPYKEAALRSVSLWSKLTEAQPILQISYTESISSELLDYKKSLEMNGAFVYFNKTYDIPCVLSSQLTRMLAYKLDVVSPNDVIITADVDAFVGTPHILDPLNQTKAVWIWQYELTEQGGETFAMSFIAATSLIWRDILGDPGDLNQLSNLYEFRNNVYCTIL